MYQPTGTSVLDVTCGDCWAQPGTPCQCAPEGEHAARYDRAYRRGVLTLAQVAAVYHQLPAGFTGHTIVVTASVQAALEAVA